MFQRSCPSSKYHMFHVLELTASLNPANRCSPPSLVNILTPHVPAILCHETISIWFASTSFLLPDLSPLKTIFESVILSFPVTIAPRISDETSGYSRKSMAASHSVHLMIQLLVMVTESRTSRTLFLAAARVLHRATQFLRVKPRNGQTKYIEAELIHNIIVCNPCNSSL